MDVIAGSHCQEYLVSAVLVSQFLSVILIQGAQEIYVKRKAYYAGYQILVYATDARRYQNIHLHRCAQVSNVQRV